jgi:hypothetical protein
VLLLLGASCSGGGGALPKDGSSDTADSSSSDGTGDRPDGSSDTADSPSTDGTGDRPDSGGVDLNAATDTNDADLKMTEGDASDDTAETGPDVHGEGGSDSSSDGASCPGFQDIGCFTGELCGSPEVPAVCMDGEWRCPAGSHGTEICNPDAGFDVNGGS